MALGSTQPLTEMSTRKSSWGVKGGRRVGLTTLPPSVSRMSENVGASTSRNPKGLHGLYRDNFTFYTLSVCVVLEAGGHDLLEGTRLFPTFTLESVRKTKTHLVKIAGPL
jgi:hypothetical protein